MLEKSILKMKHCWSKYLYQYHYSHWRLSSAQGRGWTRRSRRWRRPHRHRRRHLCCRWRRRRRRLRNHRESGRIVPGSAKGIIWLTGESHTNITLETFSFSLFSKIFKNASLSTTSDHPFKVIKMINMPYASFDFFVFDKSESFDALMVAFDCPLQRAQLHFKPACGTRDL